jgi:hypothetical protein
MNGTSVPKSPPFLPRLATPQDRPPAKGQEYPIKREFLGERQWKFYRTRRWLEYCQYWHLAYSDDVSCGTTDQISYGTKFGSSTTQLSELASSLKVGTGKLSAELSSKLSTSITVSRETSHLRTVTVPTDKCMGASIASWQRVNKCVVSQEIYLFGRPLRTNPTVLESFERDFFEDVLHYRREACCPDERGPRKIFMLDFPTSRILTFGEPAENGDSAPSRSSESGAGASARRSTVGVVHKLSHSGQYSSGEAIGTAAEEEAHPPMSERSVQTFRLVGVRGVYQVGDPVPLSALDLGLARLVPLNEDSELLTRGVLLEYEGSTDRILLQPEERAVIQTERELMVWLHQLDAASLETVLAGRRLKVDAAPRSALLANLSKTEGLEEVAQLSDVVGDKLVEAVVEAGLRHLDDLRTTSAASTASEAPTVSIEVETEI